MPDTRKRTPPPPPHAEGGKTRRRGRGPLIAGLVVAIVLFAVLRSRRSRSSEPVGDTIPLGAAYGGSIDPGGSGGTSYTDLTDQRLSSLERLVGDLGSRLPLIDGIIPGPGYPTDPNADPGEAPIGGTPRPAPTPPAPTPAPTEQGPSGQSPPTVPSSTRIGLAAALAAASSLPRTGGQTGTSGPGPVGAAPRGQIGRAPGGTRATPARRSAPPLATSPPVTVRPKPPAKPQTGQLPGKPIGAPAPKRKRGTR